MISTVANQGDYYVICDKTGFRVLRSEARFEWNGLLVRKESWRPRQPQDLVRPKIDDISVRDARPEAPYYFLSPGEVTREDL